MANSNNNPQSVIPDVMYDVEGNFVTVPVPEGSDAGKVLGAISEGTVGWVEDQGAGVIQQQSDWSETDDTKVTFIQHKPTQKPVVAGANISIVDGQDAVTISATVPTVDQTYNASSSNAQSGVAVAGALAGVNQVPSSTSADASKVLTVDAQGVPGWATPAAPSGDSDEWWGGDPGRITLSEQTIRLKFKDLAYDPRNETDTSFTDHFQSITKVEDGVYDFLFANVASGYGAGNPRFYEAFKNKYLTGNEFVILAFNFTTATYGKSKSAGGIFEGCTGLRAAYNIQDSNESQNRNGNFARAFYGCTGLVYFSVMDRQAGNKDFRIGSVVDFTDMFNGCSSLVDCNLVITRISGTAQCQYMFDGCTSLVTGPSADKGVSNANSMFAGCTSLRGFHVNNILGEFDIPADTACNCNNMFNGCISLESSDIPFFLYHTVSDAGYMFANCKKMTTPPRHIKVTSGVSLKAGYMFSSCWALESLPEMDYGSITIADYMFNGCVMLPNISLLATVTWNASLTDVSSMFNQCWGIEKGLRDVYDNMAATATITTHTNTFKGCGTAFGNPDLAQIPSAWGGTAT